MHQTSWKASNQKQFQEVTLSEVKLDEVKSDEVALPNVGMSWIPLAVVLGWLVLFIRVLGKWTLIQDEVVPPQKQVDKFPCRTCQFFSNNRYIKCAVNPSTALTEQAINCPNYCSQKERFLWQKTSKNKPS